MYKDAVYHAKVTTKEKKQLGVLNICTQMYQNFFEKIIGRFRF